jgi:hypothetical protein
MEIELKELCAVSATLGCITAILEAVLGDLPEKRRIARFKHQWEA